MNSKTCNQAPERILICRLSHIGDCVLTLPMLNAVRQARPDAWIAWATENPSPQLLDGHPDLDEVIVIPKGWLKKPGTIRSVRRELRSRQFDIALDPQSLAKTALLARLSGARVRCGFGGVHGRELSSWFNNQLVDPESTHLVDRSLELLKTIGIEAETAEFRLPVEEAAYTYTEQYLAERGMADQRFVAINPGASWPSKRWENSRFSGVASRLKESTGLSSVVTWAGDEELEMAMEICAESNQAATLAPKTNLTQLAALLDISEITIACDTGPLHIAAAMGTTCVGLYGPTRPQDSGAYGQNHFAIQNQYQSGTSRQRRGGLNKAMRTISIPQVVLACSRALAANRVRENKANTANNRIRADKAA